MAQIMNSLLPKFRLKLKKVGKTIRLFRYDLNQIPYDYTVEVRNRFKGLDLIDRVSDELWMEVRDIVQETGIKTIPKEKECKKAKWLSGEALQFSSFQFSHSVVSNSLRPHESQHARPPYPSTSPGVHSDSCPLSQ